MSLNPFRADAAVPARLASISTDAVASIHMQARQLAVDGIIDSADAQALVTAFGLNDVRDLMLLLLDEAKTYANPRISGFFVGAVGLEAPSGNLILGGNVEFPGTHLGYTLHGEGFVATRAFNRGTDVSVIAIGEAHPCAHCRQYLSEFAASGALELIDPLGHTLTMAQLYPWPFDPDYLGDLGAVAANMPWPDLDLSPSDLDPATAAALVAVGRHAHAPYSKCPGAVVLQMADGRLIAGASIESVAFNPTIGPLQAALVDLLAAGGDYVEIERATLGTILGGAVDYSASTRELLASIAPEAQLSIVGWAT